MLLQLGALRRMVMGLTELRSDLLSVLLVTTVKTNSWGTLKSRFSSAQARTVIAQERRLMGSGPLDQASKSAMLKGWGPW
eukprot:3761582-Pyramimonas_sp.AAC.1